MASMQLDEGYKVKDTVRALLRSEELRPMLERFHRRLESLCIGASINDGKVLFSPGAKTDSETAVELLSHHLLKEQLTFEGAFDPELMAQAAELGRALGEIRNEMFSSPEFLGAFTDMLKSSKNCDDLALLAKLCLNIYAGSGANPKLASMAEVSNPELVIEMTRSFATLKLSMLSAGATPAHGPVASAPAAQPAAAPAKPAQPPAVAPAAPAPKAPPAEPAAMPAPADAKQAAPQPAAKPKTLAERLAGIGFSERLAAAYVKGCADEAAALNKLDGYIEKYGPELTIMAICRNRAALNSSESVDALLHKYSSRALRLERDGKSRKRYSQVEEALKTQLGFTNKQALVVVDALAYRLAEPSEVISNLNVLEAKISHDAVRMLVLGNPPLLCRRTDIATQIRSCPPELLNAESRPPKAPEPAPEPKPAPQPEIRIAHPLKALEQKLADIQVGRELIDEILATPRYAQEAENCVRNLQAFINQHGSTFTLLALYKNRALLLDELGLRALANMKKEIAEVKDDFATRAKFQGLIDILTKELEVPEEAVYPMIVTCKSKMRPEMAIENVTLLLGRVPKPKLRHILLASPSKFVMTRDFEALLRDHPKEGNGTDEKSLSDDLAKLMAGRRPEAFIRAYVKANLGTLAHRDIQNAVVKVEYAARNLLSRSTSAGIPEEFSRKCLEAGMLDFPQIKALYDSDATPRAPAQASAEAETKAAAPGPQQAPEPAQPVPEEQAPQPATPATGAVKDAPAANQPPETIPAHKVGEPLAENPLGAPAEAEARQPSPAETLTAALSKYNVNGDIRKDIIARMGQKPDIDVAGRVQGAIGLLEQCAHDGQPINGPLKEFFSRRAIRDALFTDDPKPFDDAALELAERISSGAKRQSAPPGLKNGKNGIKHISIPAGDVPIFDRIKSFDIPEDVQIFLESRHLDPHEFVYVALKVTRWITNRMPQPQTEEIQARNCRNVAGEAADDVLKVLSPMMDSPVHGGEGYREMKSESDMDEVSLVIFKLLKQVKFSIS